MIVDNIIHVNSNRALAKTCQEITSFRGNDKNERRTWNRG